MNDKPLVLYHAQCFDGFCCAWIAHRAYAGDIEAVPVSYGQPRPLVADRRVYLLDFSYSRAELQYMHQEARLLIVLDHHASAREALVGLPYCTYADDRSAGRMTWDHFFGGSSPWLVAHPENRQR